MAHRPHPPRRVRDLLLALAVHVAALPLWVIQAVLWDFPGQTPEESARTNAAIAIYAAIVMAAYLALLVALVVWWRQGRRRLFLSPLVAAGMSWCPCLVILVVAPPVRRALVPRREAAGSTFNSPGSRSTR
jgi:hypothetical protein